MFSLIWYYLFLYLVFIYFYIAVITFSYGKSLLFCISNHGKKNSGIKEYVDTSQLILVPTEIQLLMRHF
jgi:hypothetical protein